MNDDEVTAAIHALARYLRAHPLASDSASGIAAWWLRPEDQVSMQSLQRAIEWLEQHGALEKRPAGDGRMRYRRRGDDAALDAAVAARDDAVSRRTH